MAQLEPAERLDSPLRDLRQRALTAEKKLRQQPQNLRAHIACGPGCGSCCVVNVSTLIPEGVAISRYLRTLSKEEQRDIKLRLEKLWQAVRGLDDEERLVVKRRCAFLDAQGSCQIYPVRPLLCRSITSTSAQACRDALTGAVFGDETPVLMHQYQQNLYETEFSALAAVLEQQGIDGRSFQLSGLVRFLLRQPAAEQQLLSGRRLDWQDLY